MCPCFCPVRSPLRTGQLVNGSRMPTKKPEGEVFDACRLFYFGLAADFQSHQIGGPLVLKKLLHMGPSTEILSAVRRHGKGVNQQRTDAC